MQTVRAVELALGIPVQGWTLPKEAKTSSFTGTLGNVAKSNAFMSDEVRSALKDAIPMMGEVGAHLGLSQLSSLDLSVLTSSNARQPLVTT